MADLIQEFFQRDLNEGEQDALAKLLAESPDSALKYEGLLEQNYLATGLPLPVLPQGLQSLPTGGGLALKSGFLKLLILATLLAGAAVWEFWPSPKAEMPAPLQQPVMPKVPAQRIAPPESRAWEQVKPLAVGPSQEGGELSVVVNTPQRSLVTVRVLDAAGREVRALYTGFVQPGRWDFQWDGLQENGNPAQAGGYLIDVRSGAVHLSKNIQIRLQPAVP